QPLWIEVYVPPETAPGDYTARVGITAAGAAIVEVPVALHVWPFALPSTSSLPVTFGFSALAAAKRHRGGYTEDEGLVRLAQLYSRAALRHRLSLHGGTMVPPPARYTDSGATIDWALYDREVAPFLDGAADATGKDGVLPGARFTAIDLRTPSAAS